MREIILKILSMIKINDFLVSLSRLNILLILLNKLFRKKNNIIEKKPSILDNSYSELMLDDLINFGMSKSLRGIVSSFSFSNY